MPLAAVDLRVARVAEPSGTDQPGFCPHAMQTRIPDQEEIALVISVFSRRLGPRPLRLPYPMQGLQKVRDQATIPLVRCGRVHE